RVPNGESKHAAQLFDATVAVFLVEVEDDFGIAGRAEVMAARGELWAEFIGVVALAVVGDPYGGIFVAHGHGAARAEVHNCQTSTGEHAGAEVPNGGAIRPPVANGRSHTS